MFHCIIYRCELTSAFRIATFYAFTLMTHLNMFFETTWAQVWSIALVAFEFSFIVNFALMITKFLLRFVNLRAPCAFEFSFHVHVVGAHVIVENFHPTKCLAALVTHVPVRMHKTQVISQRLFIAHNFATLMTSFCVRNVELLLQIVDVLVRIIIVLLSIFIVVNFLF